MTTAQVFSTALLVLGLALFIFILFLLVSLLRRGGGLVSALGRLLGPTILARFAGLGMALLFVRGAIVPLVTVPIRFVVALGFGIPQNLFRDFAVLSAQQQGGSSAQWAPALLTTLGKATASIYDELQSLLNAFPVGSLIELVVVWVLTSRIVSLVLQPDRDAGDIATGMRAPRFLSSLPLRVRHQVLILGIFLVGVYFTIAAIAAIPGLQESPVPAALSDGSLRVALEQARMSKEEIDLLLPVDSAGVNPLAGLEDSLSIVLAGWAQPKSESFSVELRKRQDRREELRRKLAELRMNLVRRQDQLLSEGLRAYQLHGITSRAPRERADYFQMVADWFGDQIVRIQRNYASARTYIRRSDEEAAQIVRELAFTADSIARESPEWRLALRALWSQQYSEEDVFVAPVSTASPPEPPRPGSHWGPFRFVARWLLSTESVALALITGMLGVGLFGAAVSSFIREDSEVVPAVTSPRHPTGVIIRGFSAAVVIFLAVKGGITVFAPGSGEPNPYVLLFTCFVGAVFSEDVWKWARSRLPQADEGGAGGA